MPFAILGTPRSRTAWFSKFLSYDGAVCEHEPSRNWSGPGDIKRYFGPGSGASDSMLTLRWRDVVAIPDMRVVVIARPFDEVVKSALTAGFVYGKSNLSRIFKAIDEIMMERTDIPIMPYGDLTPETCSWVFSYLLGVPCPDSWLETCLSDIVSADVAGIMRDASANSQGLHSLYG